MNDRDKNRRLRVTYLPVIILFSVALMVGLTLYSTRFSQTSSVRSIPANQAAGRAPLDENFLEGGSLQRGLTGKEVPQEFLNLETRPENPGFMTREFTVHTGKIVSAVLRNRSREGDSADWVLVKPGTKGLVQEKAENTRPIWQSIPETSDVLAVVPMTKPGESKIRLFRVPEQPGDYPFLCTIADRGMIMNGILHVVH